MAPHLYVNKNDDNWLILSPKRLILDQFRLVLYGSKPQHISTNKKELPSSIKIQGYLLTEIPGVPRRYQRIDLEEIFT